MSPVHPYAGRSHRAISGPHWASADLPPTRISAQLERSGETKPQVSHPYRWLGLKRGPSRVSVAADGDHRIAEVTRFCRCHGHGKGMIQDRVEIVAEVLEQPVVA